MFGRLLCFINLHDGLEFEDSLTLRRKCRRCGVFETNAGIGGSAFGPNWYDCDEEDLKPLEPWELELGYIKHNGRRGAIYMVDVSDPSVDDQPKIMYYAGHRVGRHDVAWEGCSDLATLIDTAPTL